MRVLTVGTSKITSNMINAFRKCGAEIFACVGRNLEKTAQFAKDNNVDLYAIDYDKALQNKDYDFVYIAVPNSLHYEYANKALDAHKNVILEKPMTINQKETRALVSKALSNNLYIFESIKTPHFIAYKCIKDDLELLGPIKMVELNFSRLSQNYEKFKNGDESYNFSYKYGGGALMDLNCYNIVFALGLFGLPNDSSYISNQMHNNDTSGTAILKYKDFIVTCIASKDCNMPSFFTIAGENGYIYSSHQASTIEEYEIHLKDGRNIKRSYKVEDCYVPMINNFKLIYENDFKEKYEQYLKLTFMEMRVLDDLRLSNHIRYTNDNKK